MSSSRVSRRTLLTSFGLGVTAVALAACGANQAASVTGAASATQSAAATAAATTSAAAAQAATTASATASASASAATSAPPAAAANASAASGEIVWLVRSGVVENTAQAKVYLPMFQQQLPNVKVNRVIIPNTSGTYNAKILTLAAAKQGLDLWGFGQNYMGFWALRMPQNLDSYISADKWDVDSYFLPGLSDIYKIHGHHYGLPEDTTYGSPLVYNKDMFDKAGIKPPPVDWDDTSWTMEQMLSDAQKLTTKAGQPDATFGIYIGLQKQTDLSFLWGGSSWMPEHYTNFIAPKTQFNNPENIAGHQYIQDLVYKYKVHPDPATVQGMNQLGDAFHTGRVAMDVDGGWLYWTVTDIKDFKVGFAATPTSKTNKQVNYDDQWIMASWSPHKDAVWAVMRILTSVDGMGQYAVASGTPPTVVASQQPWLKQMASFTGQSTDDLAKVTTGAIQKKRSQESPDHLFLEWAKISGAYSNEITKLWNSPTATAAQIIPQITPDLDKITASIYNEYNGKLPTD